MYIDAIERDDQILCWYRDDSNKLHLVEEPAPYYCYRRNEKNGDYTSLFGDRLSKMEFDDRDEFNNYVRNKRNLFESDISPVYKFLSDNFYQVDDTFVNIGFFDIEVDYDLDDGDGFPVPENPFGKINSVSLYDVRKDEYHLVVLHESVKIDYNDNEVVYVHHCVSERQVLDTFFKLIKDIDVLSAWNGDVYDIPYIMERCIIIYGEYQGIRKLCRDNFKPQVFEKRDNYGKTFLKYKLVGRHHIDYMDLYKKFSFGERTSYALDNIVKEELGEAKLKYKGDLGELYRTDPKTFFEYSLHDSRLLKKLDNKKKFINLMIMKSKQATTKFTDIFGSIKNLEHTIMNHCHFDKDEMIILPDVNKDNEKEDFPGAFVMETEASGYGWTSSIDLASLYPSTIRALNISPETHIFQCTGTQKDFVKVVEQSTDDIEMIHIPTGETVILKAFEVQKLLVDEGFTISAYGSIFESKLGLIPEVLGLWYKQRKEMKNKSKKYKQDGDDNNAEYYDMLQDIRKRDLNSLYGAISNRYSRFYSIYLAASVTATGQIIEKYQSWKADQIVKEVVTNG